MSTNIPSEPSENAGTFQRGGNGAAQTYDVRGDIEYEERPRPRELDTRRLLDRITEQRQRIEQQLDRMDVERALGWFSIGLGVTQILAPRVLGNSIGVGDHPRIMRMLGVREIASGVGLLTRRAPAAFSWARVAGDAMDLALLAAATTSRGANPGRIGATAMAVAGITAIDVYAGRRHTKAAMRQTQPNVPVHCSVTINRGAEELYAFWKNLENLPRFMRHLESVSALDDRRSHWIARAPMGARVEWDSEIVEDQPNRRLVWRTLPGSEVSHEGAVSFEPATHGRGTVVRVSLAYGAPGAQMGARIARLLGEEPALQVNEDLRRFKQLIETGEVATTDGQPTGRRGPFSSLLKRRLS